MMTSLGIYPTSRSSWLHSISPYFMIIDMTICNILSTTYVYQGSTRLSSVFEAFSLVIGGTEALSAYLNMRWKMDKVGDVQLKLQKIADQGIAFGFEQFEKKIDNSLLSFLQQWNTKRLHLFIGMLRTNVVNSIKNFAYLCCSNKHHS